MTDPHDDLPTDPLDAVASAHLDGHSTEEEAARVARDPDLTGRLNAMAAVRDMLRAEGAPVDDARRDAAISAAMAAFDATADELPGEVGSTDGATPIAVAASRRNVSRRRVRLVAAAAVAVLLALAVPLLGRLDSGGSEDDLATSALEEDTQAGQRGAAADDRAGAGGDAQAPVADEPAAAFAAAAFDLGGFEDLTALEDAVRPLLSSTDAPAPAASTTAADGAASESATCTDADESKRTGPRVLTGTATLDARPVLVLVYEGSDGEHEMVVLDADDCSVITTRSIS